MIPTHAPDDVRWYKSTYSAANGACVEVARVDEGMVVRDSKAIDGPVLLFGARAWRAFVARLPQPE